MQHHFTIQLDWQKQEENSENRRKLKNHTIRIEGKKVLEVSAAKPFKGDESLHNPEDLLLCSVASCHMMSYLYCCQQNNIEVVAYDEDNAEAILEVNSNGSGSIIKVLLKPQIKIKHSHDIQKAIELHSEAGRLCFIANSCNFPIEYWPTCTPV